MLLLNVSGLLKDRGIDQPGRYLTAKGIPYHTVNRLLKNKVQNLTYETIEKLCMICECTPNDLFVWQQNEGVIVPDDHPLHKLKAKEAVANPVERIKNLSLKKLEKLKEFMDGLEKE